MRPILAQRGRRRAPFVAPPVPTLESVRQPIITARHPLAERSIDAGLERRAAEIESAFGAIEPLLRDLARRQFEDRFPELASERFRGELGLELPPGLLQASWSVPLDVRRLYAHCVLGTFCRLVERAFDRGLADSSDGESAEALIRRWGFHAVDVTPCSDGRLSGVVDYILRVPPAIVSSRTSFAGAMFDVEAALRDWETVELRRWREASPNAATAPTRYLKLGAYHFSSADPHGAGCAAHGSDGARAARALLGRLEDFAAAVRQTFGPDAEPAILLVGIDTDTDAIRVHVPDPSGRIDVERFVDNGTMYERTRTLSRDGAKDSIRDAVAACAGVAPGDPATEGMRWFCGYLLKNNLSQVDAVRARHGNSYADGDHRERLIVVGDSVDDVQLRNLAFQAQMETVEEGAADLDVGVRILQGLHAPRGLAVPILIHVRYQAKIPGASDRARHRARRLYSAIRSRYAELARRNELYLRAVVRAGDGSVLSAVEPGEATP